MLRKTKPDIQEHFSDQEATWAFVTRKSGALTGQEFSTRKTITDTVFGGGASLGHPTAPYTLLNEVASTPRAPAFNFIEHTIISHRMWTVYD